MEHLSAEERACLVYLEETIEALEVQEDSGLSNDEPDLTEETRRRRVAGKSRSPLFMFMSPGGRRTRLLVLLRLCEPWN